MKVNLNHPILGLDGKEIEGKYLGELLSQMLASASTKENAVKMYYWATKLYGKEEIDLDPSDLSILKTFVESNEHMTVLAKAQILEKL